MEKPFIRRISPMVEKTAKLKPVANKFRTLPIIASRRKNNRMIPGICGSIEGVFQKRLASKMHRPKANEPVRIEMGVIIFSNTLKETSNCFSW
ncbi:hypothetical protein GCM10023164_05590 [Christiangramia aestuarii]